MQTLAGEGVVLTTYQGMLNALSKWPPSLLPILQQRFQRLMKQIGKDRWAVGDWVAIGFDGSRDATPRTKSNERAYCAADYGNGKTARSKKNRNGKAKQGAKQGAKHGANTGKV
ncbi:MAG: hypothetical protein WAO83_05630 [Fuerstiella sp.]